MRRGVHRHYESVDAVRSEAGVGDQTDECRNGVEGCPGPDADVDALPCFACLLEADDADPEVATDGGNQYTTDSALPSWAERTDEGRVRCTVCGNDGAELPVDHDCIYQNDLVADGGVNLDYLTNGELREQIAYAVGADPTRYGAGSDRGLKKADVRRIATQLEPDDATVDLRECDLEELYRLVCGWAGGEYQATAGNQWGICRENLKKIHRAVGGSDPREISVATDGGFHSGDHHVLYDDPEPEPDLENLCTEDGCTETGHNRCGCCGLPLCGRHHEVQGGFCSNFERVADVPGCLVWDSEFFVYRRAFYDCDAEVLEFNGTFCLVEDGDPLCGTSLDELERVELQDLDREHDLCVECEDVAVDRLTDENGGDDGE